MPQRFPARLDVDAFCTMNRRTLLRRLGTAALLTTAGGLFKGGVWASPVFAASPFALGIAGIRLTRDTLLPQLLAARA
jgi:hypothetical protein